MFCNFVQKVLAKNKIELQIHDKLIKTVTYDYSLLEKSRLDPDISDLGQTAYGALAADSAGTPDTVTCIGYALAYEYLLQKAGIYSTVVDGTAASYDDFEMPETGGHAWNIVQLDGEWYEVDTCWDDFELSTLQLDPNFVSAVMADTAKYNNRLHYFYNRTTAQMADLKPGDETTFYVDGYQAWKSQGNSTHLREQDSSFNQESKAFYEYMQSMLPEADGTKYAYEYR